MLECFRSADKVVTHAGVGSILCADREGHVPLVVPRRHDLGEHVDDHQLELARALADARQRDRGREHRASWPQPLARSAVAAGGRRRSAASHRSAARCAKRCWASPLRRSAA